MPYIAGCVYFYTETPQEIILRPVLFNIFIDTLLLKLLLNNNVAYADDIVLPCILRHWLRAVMLIRLASRLRTTPICDGPLHILGVIISHDLYRIVHYDKVKNQVFNDRHHI